MQTVIITGANSQSALAFCEYFKEKTNYHLVGLARCSRQKFPIDNHYDTVYPFCLKLFDYKGLLLKYKPSLFINCAGYSFVGDSDENPKACFDQNSQAVLEQLESIRRYTPDCRYANFGSSEEFGNPRVRMQDEKTELKPINAYGQSKVNARNYVQYYRKRHNLYAVQHWTYNFESKRRKESFVLKKIANHLVEVKSQIGNNETPGVLDVGCLLATRDFSHIDDIVIAYSLSLEQVKPKDYVLGSGNSYYIHRLVSNMGKMIGLKLKCYDDNLSKVPHKKTPLFAVKVGGKDHVILQSCKKYFRIEQNRNLQADITQAKRFLDWNPEKDISDILKSLLTENE